MVESKKNKTELEERAEDAGSRLMIGFVVGLILAGASTLGLFLTKIDAFFP